MRRQTLIISSLICLILINSKYSLAQTGITIEGETSITFDEERIERIITWIIIDDNPMKYNISIIDDNRFQNESILLSGEWSLSQLNGTVQEFPVSINIILEIGIYTFIIRVADYDHNTAEASTVASVGNVDDINVLPGPGLPLSIDGFVIGLIMITSLRIAKQKYER